MHACIHVYWHPCAGAYALICVPVDLRLISEFFLQHSLPLYSLRQDLSIVPEPTNMASLSS